MTDLEASIRRPVEILLVEDDPSDVKPTVHALKRNNLANNIHVVRDGVDALGVDGYIVKPVDFGQFTDAMRTVGLYRLPLNHPPRR